MAGELHKGPAYSRESLVERMSMMLEKSMLFHVKEVTSFIDASSDIGFKAIEAALEVKKNFKDDILFRIGTQPIFGFKNSTASERWETYEEAANIDEVSILGALPEVDNKATRIGFKEHCYLVLNKALELGKEAHFHLDQKNSPSENGTEIFLQVVEGLDHQIRAKTLGEESIVKKGRPFIWLIHIISPSAYDQERFLKLIQQLKKYNIGVICCPRAALSMLQLRPEMSPVHNSIARVLELVKHEIPVMIGTDNVADIFIPTGDINMLREVAFLPDSLRYYVKKLWVKLACGQEINNVDRDLIGRSIYQDSKAFRGIDSNFSKI